MNSAEFFKQTKYQAQVWTTDQEDLVEPPKNQDGLYKLKIYKANSDGREFSGFNYNNVNGIYSRRHIVSYTHPYKINPGTIDEQNRYASVEITLNFHAHHLEEYQARACVDLTTSLDTKLNEVELESPFTKTVVRGVPLFAGIHADCVNRTIWVLRNEMRKFKEDHPNIDLEGTVKGEPGVNHKIESELNSFCAEEIERAARRNPTPSGVGQASYLSICGKELAAPFRSGESPPFQGGVLQSSSSSPSPTPLPKPVQKVTTMYTDKTPSSSSEEDDKL